MSMKFWIEEDISRVWSRRKATARLRQRWRKERDGEKRETEREMEREKAGG